ncbi:MAG: hypothetical protein N2Z21_09755 [Candidatus Sumerlaeaceae bacterium]|nr:hypothetical protein [Candidatus Sumerlaeaceae bacterium]
MSLPQFYQLGSLRFQEISVWGDTSIFCVSVPPTQSSEEIHYMQHRWTLTLLGSLGAVEVFAGKQWHVLQHMREFLVPPQTLHAFRNMHASQGRFYLIARPGGFEEYVKEHGVILEPQEFVQLSHTPEIYRVDRWRAKAQETAPDDGTTL